MAIVKGAGLVMKAIIEEGDAEIAAKMQDLALAEGALPRHLHTAMFTQSSDSRMLTVRYHCPQSHLSVCVSVTLAEGAHLHTTIFSYITSWGKSEEDFSS